MKQINEEADVDERTLRISMDAKATVKVGPFARGGKSRVPTKAADHDFQPTATVTPVGIFLPAFDAVFFYGVTSKVTSDCLVDRLIDSVDTLIQYARTMTWKGVHPVVELVTTPYQTGVKLTKEAMDVVETQLQRLPSLEK